MCALVWLAGTFASQHPTCSKFLHFRFALAKLLQCCRFSWDRHQEVHIPSSAAEEVGHTPPRASPLPALHLACAASGTPKAMRRCLAWYACGFEVPPLTLSSAGGALCPYSLCEKEKRWRQWAQVKSELTWDKRQCIELVPPLFRNFDRILVLAVLLSRHA